MNKTNNLFRKERKQNGVNPLAPFALSADVDAQSIFGKLAFDPLEPTIGPGPKNESVFWPRIVSGD